MCVCVGWGGGGGGGYEGRQKKKKKNNLKRPKESEKGRKRVERGKVTSGKRQNLIRAQNDCFHPVVSSPPQLCQRRAGSERSERKMQKQDKLAQHTQTDAARVMSPSCRKEK